MMWGEMPLGVFIMGQNKPRICEFIIFEELMDISLMYPTGNGGFVILIYKKFLNSIFVFYSAILVRLIWVGEPK